MRDLVYSKRHHKQHEARKRKDDDHEDQGDREDSWHSEVDEAGYARLDEEGDRGAENECSEEVPEQVEDHERDHKSAYSEGDLEVAPAPLRIELPSRDGDAGQWGRVFRLTLVVGAPCAAAGTNISQFNAV